MQHERIRATCQNCGWRGKRTPAYAEWLDKPLWEGSPACPSCQKRGCCIIPDKNRDLYCYYRETPPHIVDWDEFARTHVH